MSLLQGVRVVEAASMILVPAAAAIMADFGADVVKVEPPGGDENRRLHELPAMPGSTVPYAFLVDNRGKKGIVLDLKMPDGAAALRQLVASADVFMTNYRVAARARLGITYEALTALNPRLIYASGSGFGERGPEAHKPAYDTVVYWSRSGIESSLLTLDGRLGGIPAGSGDHPSALALFGAVMMALFARERTGRGCHVSTSLLAAGVWANATTVQAQLCGATFPPRVPRERSHSFGSVYYRTRDGRTLKMSLVNPTKLWPRLCRALERVDLVDDPRFATTDARRTHSPVLIAILDEVFGGRDAAHWRRRLEEHDIPFAILPTYEEIAGDAQLAANEVFVPIDDPRHGAMRTVDNPIRVHGVARTPPWPAPDLGQHTDEVLRDLARSRR